MLYTTSSFRGFHIVIDNGMNSLNQSANQLTFQRRHHEPKGTIICDVTNVIIYIGMKRATNVQILNYVSLYPKVVSKAVLNSVSEFQAS